MAGTITIELKDLHFFAEHGVYDEEAKLGNEFIVDLFISYDTGEEVITSIHQTINYVSVYNLVKEVISIRQMLLETVAMIITKKLQQAYPQIKKVAITITKKRAPVESFIGTLGISYTREF